MNNTQISLARQQGPRDNLEDDFSALQIILPSWQRELAVFGVNDGVGGNNYGEVASDSAAKTISSYLMAMFAGMGNDAQAEAFSPDSMKNILTQAFEIANQAILQQVQEQSALKGMATTAVVAIILEGFLHVAWLGDSRCYLHSEGQLQQITTDHSEVQPLIDAGLVSPDQAKNHPLSHTINRYLGRCGNSHPDTIHHRLEAGDIILLCSDGLTDVVSDSEIHVKMQACCDSEIPLEKLPQILVQQALDSGTHDNTTVLCCEYQTRPITKSPLLGLTMTGAYPVSAAQALRNHVKENHNE